MMTIVEVGDLLISHIALRDGWFDGTVVLILDADPSGVLGVVLNRLADVSLESVLPQWTDLVSEPAVLYSGGPVSPNGAICLASPVADDEPPGWRRVFDRVGLLHLDTPVELVAGAYDHIRIYAGYAGWSAGQLESELSRDAWFVASARYDDIFGLDHEHLWRSVLRRQKPEVALWSTWTEHPEQN